MIFEAIVFSLAGIVLGVTLGLLPGLHINNILPFFIGLATLIPNPQLLAVLIVSTAIAQVFTSFIPSIFIGAPEADSSLAVLPGHRMLLEGRGYEAIKLTVIGGLGALLVSLITLPLLANYFSQFYELSRPYIQYALLVVIILMIAAEKEIRKMLLAVLVIFLSGMLGLLTLNSTLVSNQNILFPLLAGLFGISTMIVSINQKANVPEQKGEHILGITKVDIIKSVILGSIAGIIVGFLPAVGVSQAATFVQYLGGMGEARAFLISLSGINVANEIFSLNSLYLVGNPRSGSSVAIEKILGIPTFYDIVLFMGVIMFVSGISALITLYLGKKIPAFLSRLDYKLISISIIIFMSAMVALLTGVYGLLILFTATAIGILSAYLEIRRSHCMGVLIIPSIFFFAGLNPLIISILRI